MNGYRVSRCLLCGNTAIDASPNGRVVTTSCRTCHAVLIIEFDPPDEPTVHARIERMDDPRGCKASESDPDRRADDHSSDEISGVPEA
jgi:hypothetical protein